MTQFPRDEVGIIDLGRKLVNGLVASKMNFASMPISKSEFEIMLANYNSQVSEIAQMQTQISQKIADKNKVLKQITIALKRNLHFLEAITGGRDSELKKFGWGARQARKIAVPNQPRALEVLEKGEDWVELDWKSPVGGGKVKFYKLQRLVKGETEWREIATETKTEIRLTNQPLKTELQFRVAAVNQAGESLPGNAVEVVL